MTQIEKMSPNFFLSLHSQRSLDPPSTGCCIRRCVMVAGDANLDPRDKIACNISQLLIFNAVKGTYHTVNTPAVRHSNERESPFSLYRGLRLHGHGRDKKQIGIDKDHGISVSYGRVMEVKRGVARAVCARSAQDGIVVPSNVFTTHDADNIDSTAEGNFSMSEFHGYALSVTNHCSHENPGVKRSPIILNPSDTSIPKLPDSYVIQPSVELAQTDVFATKFNEARDGANDAVDWNP